MNFKNLGLTLVPIIIILLAFIFLKHDAATGGGKVKITVNNFSIINVKSNGNINPAFQSKFARFLAKEQYKFDISIENKSDSKLETGKIIGQFFWGPDKLFADMIKDGGDIVYTVLPLSPNESQSFQFMSDDSLSVCKRCKRYLKLNYVDSNGKTIAWKKEHIAKN